MTIEVLILMLMLIIILNLISLYTRGVIFSLIAVMLGIFTVASLFYDNSLEITRYYNELTSSWVSYTIQPTVIALGMAFLTVISFFVILKVNK